MEAIPYNVLCLCAGSQLKGAVHPVALRLEQPIRGIGHVTLPPAS